MERRTFVRHNVVIVPQTGDIFLQEDSPGEQFVRRLPPRGRDLRLRQEREQRHRVLRRRFDPDAHALYLNQQRERGGTVEGLRAVRRAPTPSTGRSRSAAAVDGPATMLTGRGRRRGD